jgi:hypothetical protein
METQPSKPALAANPPFDTIDQLLDGAEFVSRNAEEIFQHSAYLYFLARYMVAMFESSCNRSDPTLKNQ